MKLLPASLATRTVLLIVAAIALAELATFSLIFQHGRASHANRTAQFIGGQIRFLQASLSELDAKNPAAPDHARRQRTVAAASSR